MPITFPHFGSLIYVFQSLMKELKMKNIMVPSKPTRRTAELGARYGPEFICTPFKLTLGTFIEMLDKGADVLVMGGCNSFCRFGYYWPIQKLILEDLGYDFKFLHVDYESPRNLLKNLKDASSGLNMLQTIRALRITWLKNRLTDLTDKLLFTYRALEKQKGVTDILANKIFQKIVQAEGVSQIRALNRKIPDIFKKEIDVEKKKNLLKVAICGEIYAVIEPALNLDVHRKLNNLGVIVETTVSLTRFTDIPRKLNPFYQMHWQKARELGRPYVANRIGGETMENLGDIIYYKKHGWDGMVHIYPFTCMPEIITRAIAPQISKEYDMPFLSLVVDEHTGEAGFQTRLEAFIDLLRRKKQDKVKLKHKSQKKNEMGVYV
ncbi:MAG: hypothetical protein ACTSRE_12515 [Promethearchaeota archaeon]